jgi:hypothetical protein
VEKEVKLSHKVGEKEAVLDLFNVRGEDKI